MGPAEGVEEEEEMEVGGERSTSLTESRRVLRKHK